MTIKKNSPGTPCGCLDCNCSACYHSPEPAPYEWLLTVTGCTGTRSAYNGEWVLTRVGSSLDSLDRVCWIYTFTGGDSNPSGYLAIRLHLLNSADTDAWDKATVTMQKTTLPEEIFFPWSDLFYSRLPTKAGVQSSSSDVCKCYLALHNWTWDNSPFGGGIPSGFEDAVGVLTAMTTVPP